jgi:hypothetical protein
MRRRITGVSGGFGPVSAGLQWEHVPGDLEAAHEVLNFMEDRRLLFGLRHLEDEYHCVESAMQTRSFLTEVLGRGTTGPGLTASLKAMRAASRAFVSAGGRNGENFRDRTPYGLDTFSVALGELRALMGQQMGLIAQHYEIGVEDDLASVIVWPVDEDDDPSWVPGFNE